MDEENFGVSRGKARSAITFAIDSWKSQLQKVEYDRFLEEDLKPWRELRLGTQMFTEVSCEEQNINLRFQLGKLSATQHAQVGNARRYVAKAFETSYDEVNMRGTGFIYIAPESGPLRPDEPEAEEHFWNSLDGSVLRYVLMHEMGHVFGFSHSENMLMAEDGPQKLINKNFINFWATSTSNIDSAAQTWLSYLFGYSNDAMGDIYGSRNSEENKALFGDNAELDHAIHCEHENNAYVSCSMYEVTANEQGQRIRGKKVGHIEGNSFAFGGTSVASVKIPRAQTVLTISDLLRTAWGRIGLKLGTARKQNFSMSGIYVSEDGKTRMPMRVGSMAEYPSSLLVEIVYKNSFHVIAQ